MNVTHTYISANNTADALTYSLYVYCRYVYLDTLRTNGILKDQVATKGDVAFGELVSLKDDIVILKNDIGTLMEQVATNDDLVALKDFLTSKMDEVSSLIQALILSDAGARTTARATARGTAQSAKNLAVPQSNEPHRLRSNSPAYCECSARSVANTSNAFCGAICRFRIKNKFCTEY